MRAGWGGGVSAPPVVSSCPGTTSAPIMTCCRAQGFIPASELRNVVAAFSPSAAVDMYGLLTQHPQLGRPAAAPVRRGPP